MSDVGAEQLRATAFLDYDAPEVRDFVRRSLAGCSQNERERAVRLYYAVRDGIQYEIYGANLSRGGLRASDVVRRGRGLCIHKSILYAASARAIGIPSRLAFVDVRNHVLTPKLRSLLSGDVLRFHCLTLLGLDGRWVRVAPVFSARLCRLYRMTPLEFDGRNDAVLQAADEQGHTFIETVHDHGEFDDLPYEMVLSGLRATHGRIFDEGQTQITRGSMVREAPSA
jgi:transglutaminase-like putative cysteine protease